MEQTPVTYFPLATQRQLARNRERVRGKPYAHFFQEPLTIPTRVLPALSAPMEARDALPLERASRLLEAGYHAVENGHCELGDGTGYTASLVDFPGCTPEMFHWYFWWHNVEPERYTLWYPHNHIRSVPRMPMDAYMKRWERDQLVGLELDVDEYIGPYYQEISIEILAPEALGLDSTKFTPANVAGAGCARVWMRKPRIAVAKMVHLLRNTEYGFEMRSRYWMGHSPALGLGSFEVPLGVFSRVGLSQRRKVVGRMAYEQLLHDQIEFTHLASILPALYAEFGADGQKR